MTCKCRECGQEADRLYLFKFWLECRECFLKEYDCIYDGENYVCDECGNKTHALYMNGNTGICEDCILNCTETFSDGF